MAERSCPKDTTASLYLTEYSALKKSANNLELDYETIHAEVDAILRLPKKTNFRKLTLYVAREGMKMSRPCEKCEALIKALGIRKVFYSCDGAMLKM